MLISLTQLGRGCTLRVRRAEDATSPRSLNPDQIIIPYYLAICSDASGSSKVIVAIIDTGTELTHPDLAPNIWVNSKEIPNNGIDDDKNGYIDDYNGYSFAGKCSGYDPSTRLCSKVSMILGDSHHRPWHTECRKESYVQITIACISV